MFAVLLGLPLLIQEADLRRLIDALSSESIEERNEGAEGLLRLGEKARPALETAAKREQGEPAQRARDLLETLDLRRTLGPGLLQAIPELDRRLLRADDAAWTDAFLQATAQTHTRRAFPALSRADFEPLAARAVRGASVTEWRRACDRVLAWNLRSAVPELIRRLEDPDPQRLFPLADALEHFRPPEAAPKVLALLEKEQDAQKQGNYTRIAAAIGGPEVSAFFLEQMKKDRHAIYGMGLEYLAGVCTEADIPRLVALLDLDETPGPDDLARVLTRLNARKAIPLLVAKVDQATGSTRLMAAMTLCEIRHRSVLPHLKALIQDRNRNVRVHAVRTLGVFGEEEAGPTLRAMLKDTDMGSRLTVARMLAEWADPAALPVIRDFVKDPQIANDMVRFLACYPAEMVADELVAIVREKKPGAFGAMGWVGFFRPDEALKLCPPYLKDGNEYTRRAASAALARTRRPEAVDLILPLLKDPDAGAACAAAEDLARIGGPRAIEALLKEAAAPESRAKYGAVRGLARLADPSTGPALMSLLESNDIMWRREVFQALVRIDPPELRPHLKTFLTDSDSGIRAFSAELLARRGDPDGIEWMLSAGYGRFALNAIRNPEAWEKLLAVRFEPPLRTWGRKGMEELALRGGLKLEIDEDYDYSWDALTFEARAPLEALARTNVILEPGVLRMLPGYKARAFWGEWAAARSRR